MASCDSPADYTNDYLTISKTDYVKNCASNLGITSMAYLHGSSSELLLAQQTQVMLFNTCSRTTVAMFDHLGRL